MSNYHVIHVPKRDNANQWTEFIYKNRLCNLNKHTDSIILDFNQCSFLEPRQLVCLACLIEEYHLEGKKVEFADCSNGKVCEYLHDIKFFDYWDKDFDRSNYRKTNHSSHLCLWKINKDMTELYTRYAQEYAENNWLEGKDLEPLNISLAEAFNNIFDHSQSKVTGYCLSQHYRKINTLRISICDFGIGIPTSVNNFFTKQKKPILSQEEAILRALQQKFTVSSTPQNRGFGLDTIKSIVNEFKGELEISSNSINLHIKNKIPKTETLEKTFAGTLININLDTSLLGIKEDEEDEEFLL